MNSGHNPSASFTYEQALYHNEQLAQVLLNNVATSLEGLESNYFKAKRLDDTQAKISTNNCRNILESNCAYLNQFYSDGVLSAETSQHVQNAVSRIEIVLSIYPSFPQSETIPDARKTEVDQKNVHEPVYNQCKRHFAQRDSRARTSTSIPTSTNLPNETPHHSHSDPCHSGNARRKL